ncbi:MAG: glutamate--tRNA ligase, partial [Flavobacteriaceae bacterium]|nr:glutamate--tRNA ligase [Flavobacteriaceae bacterium]
DGITKAGGRFDPERCKWFNQQHLHKKNSAFIEAYLDELLQQKGVANTGVSTAAVVGLVQKRLTLLTDLWDESHFFYVAPVVYDEKAVRKEWKEKTPGILSEIVKVIERAPNEEAETSRAAIKLWAGENNVSLRNIMAPLRIALVGALNGPDVFEICHVLGKKNSLERIRSAISIL